MAKPILPTSDFHKRIAKLPDQPGVYIFKDAHGDILYVGKALSLRKRVRSYFRKPNRLDRRIARLIERVCDLEVRQTPSEADALLLEAQLIKENKPHYNIALRDDKTYPILKISNESFPRLLVVRRKYPDGAIYFGPYTDAGLMREAIRFLRRVFPMRTCRTFPKTPCLEYHLGQCLAPCAGYIDSKAYDKIVGDLVAFLNGKRENLLRDLSRRMNVASRDRRFEEAARLRDQIQALTSVIVAKEKSLAAGPLEQLASALKLSKLPRRIEAFDVSNIFGKFAVGSMVVFEDGKPHKAHYRRFKIETVLGIDDCRMMQELIRRRYSGNLSLKLPLPDLILIDGGKPQLSSANCELDALSLSLPVIGLAKRFEHIYLPSKEEPVVLLPSSAVLKLLQHIRDEAHRFAISYHRRLRNKTVTISALDDIAGVGPIRKMRLLRRFGSIEHLATATPDEIANSAGLSKSIANDVVQFLSRRNEKKKL